MLLLTASVFFLPNAIMRYSGYCFEQERYLTSQEKFDLAATTIINRKEKTLHDDYTINEAGEKIRYKRYIANYKYSNLAEFYALNPNCCFFLKQIEDGEARRYSIPWGKRISGRLNALIYVSYIFAFDEQNHNRPIYGGAYFGISNCGKLLSSGETISLIDPDW